MFVYLCKYSGMLAPRPLALAHFRFRSQYMFNIVYRIFGFVRNKHVVHIHLILV